MKIVIEYEVTKCTNCPYVISTYDGCTSFWCKHPTLKISEEIGYGYEIKDIPKTCPELTTLERMKKNELQVRPIS